MSGGECCCKRNSITGKFMMAILFLSAPTVVLFFVALVRKRGIFLLLWDKIMFLYRFLCFSKNVQYLFCISIKNRTFLLYHIGLRKSLSGGLTPLAYVTNLPRESWWSKRGMTFFARHSVPEP